MRTGHASPTPGERPSPRTYKKVAAPAGAAKFREETSKKAVAKPTCFDSNNINPASDLQSAFLQCSITQFWGATQRLSNREAFYSPFGQNAWTGPSDGKPAIFAVLLSCGDAAQIR